MNVHKKFFSKIGVNYLIYGILALIFQIIVINIIGTLDTAISHNINIMTVLTSICNYVLPLPVFIYLMRKLTTSQLERQNLDIKTFLTYIAVTFTLMWLGNTIGQILTSLIGSAIQNDVANPIQNLINTTDIWLNLVLISIIGPVFEEIIFRKILIDRTIKYGARISIMLSALIFALFHGNLNQFVYAFFIGGYFAYAYIKTGKITYTILLHIIINIIGSVISLIVAQSTGALMAGTQTHLDLAIIILYMILFCILIVSGIIGLIRLANSRFNGSKTEIALKNPLKAVFLNYGMILFIGFFLFELIYQLIT